MTNFVHAIRQFRCGMIETNLINQTKLTLSRLPCAKHKKFSGNRNHNRQMVNHFLTAKWTFRCCLFAYSHFDRKWMWSTSEYNWSNRVNKIFKTSLNIRPLPLLFFVLKVCRKKSATKLAIGNSFFVKHFQLVLPVFETNLDFLLVAQTKTNGKNNFHVYRITRFTSSSREILLAAHNAQHSKWIDCDILALNVTSCAEQRELCIRQRFGFV